MYVCRVWNFTAGNSFCQWPQTDVVPVASYVYVCSSMSNVNISVVFPLARKTENRIERINLDWRSAENKSVSSWTHDKNFFFQKKKILL